MESRLVLVIEDDEHTASQLAAAIREADYEVVVSPSAKAGLDIAIEIKPDCVICDVDLPDEDGYWVARNIRTHPSPVSVTPFLFLSAYDDAEARIEGFNVGADVYLTKPFVVEEVVAQVSALVQMAWRLRQRRDSMLSLSPGAPYGTAALEGDMRQMSVATVLSVLGMERRTGMFEVVSKKRRAQIEIAAGYVVHGTIGGTRVGAVAAIRVMLTWKVGRFTFTPLPPCDPPASLRTVQATLLDAAKEEDEAAASVASVRAGGRMAATSFGGPPSRPDDTGPPSSRALREPSAPPISLKFDLLPSRRPEEIGPSEVAAAIDEPLSALEQGWPTVSDTMPPPAPRANVPPFRTPLPPVAVRVHEVTRDGNGERRTNEIAGPISVHARDDGGPMSDEGISVDLAELEGDAVERSLHEELSALPKKANAPRYVPTPPAGTPLPGMRRQAIMPPPDSAAARVKPLPAPPAPPRPIVPRAPAEKARAAPRAQPKKG